MTTSTALFPPANRTAALVAFLRTFWQTVRAVGGLTVIGGGALEVNHIATLDWVTIGYAALGVIASGLIAGAISGGDILTNGLPTAYSAAVIAANIAPGAITPKHSTDTPSPAPEPAPMVMPPLPATPPMETPTSYTPTTGT